MQLGFWLLRFLDMVPRHGSRRVSGQRQVKDCNIVLKRPSEATIKYLPKSTPRDAAKPLNRYLVYYIPDRVECSSRHPLVYSEPLFQSSVFIAPFKG